MFGQKVKIEGSSGSGSGRPFGGGEGNDHQEILQLLRAICVVGLSVAIIGTLTYMKINYKEIGLKEFGNK